MKELGEFLQGLAMLAREGIIAKKLAAYIAKKVLRQEGLMPEPAKAEGKKAEK